MSLTRFGTSLLRKCGTRSVFVWCAVITIILVLKIGLSNRHMDQSLSQDDVHLLEDKPKIKRYTGHIPADHTKQLKSNHSSVKCAQRPKHVLPQVHDAWYAYYNPPTHSEVYIFSAFMDDRPENTSPVVRMLVVSTRIQNATYCQLWYEGEDEPVASELKITKNGRGHRIGKIHYDQYYFTCTVSRPRPILVSVTAQACETPQSLIPIIYPMRGIEHEFAVCVPITFGSVDVHRLVEWVEAHRILGVTEISIYYVHMSEKALKPFHYYADLGIMKLYSIPTVPHWENTYNGNKLSSMVSLNDCMYRNMYRYKWIIDIDFDELIVPNTVNSYPKLLKAIDNSLDKKNSGVRSYTFRNAYFWVNCGNALKEPKHTVMLRHIYRERVNGYLYAPKSILSPLTCVSLFNHYCYHSLPTKGKPFTIDVNSTFAFSHHYRKIRSKENCKILKEKGIEDRSLLRFKPALEKQYKTVIQDMKLE